MKTKIQELPAALFQGKIENLSCKRALFDFMFTPSERVGMAVTALAGSILGSGGVAVGLSNIARDTSEEADLLEFTIQDRMFKAWVWKRIFNDGDEVEVVAECVEGEWHAYGIRRLSDSIVMLHPHCSTGRYGHFRAAAKWWLILSVPLVLAGTLIVTLANIINGNHSAVLEDALFVTFQIGGTCLGVSSLIAVRIASKYMIFVKLSERIFETFGWKSPRFIDLPRHTRKHPQPGDGPLFGLMVFRYGEPSKQQLR